MVRGGNLAMAALFAYAAFVQLNDPDWLLWTGLYALATVGCILFAVDKLPVLYAAGLAVACLLGAIGLAPTVVKADDMMHSEAGREMWGLMMVAVWMSTLLSAQWRRRLGGKEL